MDNSYLKKALTVAFEVLEELTKEQPGFSHIDLPKMREITLSFCKFEEEELTEKVIKKDLLRFILKEELLAFAKRNGGIITHKECYQIVMGNINNPNESNQLNAKIKGEVEVEMKQQPLQVGEI